jgi:heme-degrading monooxygenase HmoA
MYVAVYRWKIKEGCEERFRQGWLRLTREIYRERGSLGSRLHKSDDGGWVAYAQWPNREAWEAAAGVEVEDKEAAQMMSESVAERHPDIYLEVIDDLLQKPNV